MSDDKKSMGTQDMVAAGVRRGEINITMVDDTDKVWLLRVPHFNSDPIEGHYFNLDVETEEIDVDEKTFRLNTLTLELDVRVSTLSITQVGILVGDQVVGLEGLEGETDGSSTD